jgi:hypothetical protein
MNWVDLVISVACIAGIMFGGVLSISHAWVAIHTPTWSNTRRQAAWAGLYAAPVAACARILWAVWP